MKTFGIIGFRKTRGTGSSFKSWFSKKHCSSLMLLNNDELMKRDLLFKPWPAWEDLNLCNEVEEKGLIVLKLNAFGVTKTRNSLTTDLYCWTESDEIKGESYSFDVDSINKKIVKFLNSLRVSKTDGEPLLDLPDSTFTTNGTSLYWLKNMDEFRPNPDDLNITVMTKMVTVKNSNLKNTIEMKNWLKNKCNKLKIDAFVVKSSCKPMVLEDFVIMHAKFPSKHKNKRMQQQLPHEYQVLLKTMEELKGDMRIMQDKIIKLEQAQLSSSSQKCPHGCIVSTSCHRFLINSRSTRVIKHFFNRFTTRLTRKFS